MSLMARPAASTARVGYDDIPVLRKPNISVPTPSEDFATELKTAISGPSTKQDSPEPKRDTPQTSKGGCNRE